MTRRALGGLVAAIVVALGVVGFLPGPASARQGPVVTITSPGDNATVGNAVSIDGQATMNNGRVDGATITITSAANHPVPGPKGFSGNSSTLSFPWSVDLPYNGVYTVSVSAVGTETPVDFDGQQSGSDQATFNVEQAAAAPTGVKATVDQVKRTITISWAANPEPDIIGYGVYRKEGANYVGKYAGEARSYTDDLGSLPAGTYQYQVYAARPSADGTKPMVSGPTATSGKLTSSPPTTTSTTDPSGTGAHTTTTTASTNSTKGPTVASHGKVDLSGFTALLPNGGNKLPAARETPAPDPGFDETLPFKSGDGTTTPAPSKDDSVEALGGQQLASSKGESQQSPLLFLAAGLLVTVILMHVLWLRDEVNREPLPAVTPADPAEPKPA